MPLAPMSLAKRFPFWDATRRAAAIIVALKIATPATIYQGGTAQAHKQLRRMCQASAPLSTAYHGYAHARACIS